MLDSPKDVNLEKRKTEHIEICLQQQVTGFNITNGLEKYRFLHQALPDIDFTEIRLDTAFLGKTLRVPFLASSMTGGTEIAWNINKNLAAAAEKNGWAMGVGSMRAAIENEDLAYTFRIRKFAPTIPILANLGAVQLNYGYGVDQCRRAVELAEADGLMLHLNSLQEVIQPEGNTNFKGLLAKIEQLCTMLEVPVGVKEVGWGLSGDVAVKLANVSVQFIDVAGAGGTSWSQVEKFRMQDALRRQAAEAFAEWGIPTAECIRDVRSRLSKETIIGSGGMNTGLDSAKAIALGADLVGFGRKLLEPAANDRESLQNLFDRLELELRLAMFGVGVSRIEELKLNPRLQQKEK